MTLRAVVGSVTGGTGVTTVTGNIVNNADPTAPVVNVPTSPNPYAVGNANTGGAVSTVPISINALANSLGIRGVGGVLTVGTPTAADHAATKDYVDSRVGVATVTGNIVSNTDPANPVVTLPFTTAPYVVGTTSSGGGTASTVAMSISPTSSSVVLRDAEGNVKTAAPVDNDDAATKLYVDNKPVGVMTVTGTAVNNTNPANPIINYPTAATAFVVGTTSTGNATPTTVELAAGATANSVPLRGTGGVLSVGTPTAAAHAVTKGYVDALNTGVSSVTGNIVVNTDPANPTVNLPVGAGAYVIGSIAAGGAASPIVLSSAAAATSVALRGASGVLIVGTPTAPAHAATKAYVDAINTGVMSVTGNIVDNTSPANPVINIPQGSSSYVVGSTSPTGGNALAVSLTSAATPDTAVLRNSGAAISIGTPTAPDHAATKAYVDAAAATGVQTVTGNIVSNTDPLNPTVNLPVGGTAYVLGSTTAGGAAAAVTMSSTTATANSVALRGTGGILIVGTPTATTHATTKAYVDALVPTRGTFTPSISFATPGNASFTATTAVGTYRTYGDIVDFELTISGTLTHTTASGNVRITGLPIAAAASSTLPNVVSVVAGVVATTDVTWDVSQSLFEGQVPVSAQYIELSALSENSAPVKMTTAQFVTGRVYAFSMKGRYVRT